MHGSVKKNGTQRVWFVPLFWGPTWEGAKRAFSDISQGGHMICAAAVY